MSLENPQHHLVYEIKQKVRQSPHEDLKVVNKQLINLCWQHGKYISRKQFKNWDKVIVPTFSKDLQSEFPEIGGFSVGNLWLMTQFYNEYHAIQFLQPLKREISWAKHITNLNKCKNDQQREIYIRAAKKIAGQKTL